MFIFVAAREPKIVSLAYTLTPVCCLTRRREYCRRLFRLRKMMGKKDKEEEARSRVLIQIQLRINLFVRLRVKIVCDKIRRKTIHPHGT